MPRLAHVAVVVRDYGKVAVFADVYGNLWDLIEFAPAHPAGS